MSDVRAGQHGPDAMPLPFDAKHLRSGDLLLAVRINNLPHIEAVYGRSVSAATAGEVQDAIARWVPGTQAHRAGEIIIEAAVPLLSRNRELAPATLIESLCIGLMTQPLLLDGEKLHVSVSVGYALIPEDGAPLQALSALLEQCHNMLQASWSAPDFIAAWDGNWLAGYRADMAAAATLLHRIDRGETFFVWQPVRRTAESGVSLYHEALLRTSSKDGQHISCGQAIQSLERIGLARILDRYSASAILDQLEDDPIACVGVNISAQSASFHLNGKDALWNELRTRLAEDRSLGPRLVVEITESSPAASQKDLTEFIAFLRAMGCRIAIDDFGAGHNGLRQLLVLTPDIVKLDSFFISGTGQSEQRRRTFHHVLGLAQSLAPMVVVEGVESAALEEIAREEGAIWLQGYHMGHPSVVRSWEDATYSDSIQALLAFKGRFKQPSNGQ